jgi:hypothetical protein
MKYRVVFRERQDQREAVAENPIGFLQNELSGRIVRRASFLSRQGPDGKPPADPFEHDEELRRLGTEIWEYDVAEGKDQEFKDALLNSGSILEFTLIGDGERD